MFFGSNDDVTGENHSEHDDDVTENVSWMKTFGRDWFERLMSMYAEEGRAYHTIVHLWEMFGYVDALLPLCTEGEADTDTNAAVLTMAVFFHDAVYDPKSTTNEEDSADLYDGFVRDARDARGTAVDDRSFPHVDVRRIILATKSHALPPDDDGTPTRVLLDADMAVLGKRPHAYDAYARAVRREYAFVERATYCEKRADVLSGFLDEDKGSLFATPEMRDVLEAQARLNLRREIALLRAGGEGLLDDEESTTSGQG